MYQAVFRYMCKLGNIGDMTSEEQIFLQETKDPHSFEMTLADTSPAFTESYLQSFRLPLPEDPTKVALLDRLDTGWLAWGRKMEVARLTGWDEYEEYADKACQPGIDQIATVVQSKEFWQTVRFEIFDVVLTS